MEKACSIKVQAFFLQVTKIDRMKYIWYLCHVQEFTSEHVFDNEVDMYGIFNGDCQFIKPLHQGSKENMEKSSVLSKYFKGV